MTAAATRTASAENGAAANDMVNIAIVGCGGRGGGATNDNLTITTTPAWSRWPTSMSPSAKGWRAA